MPVDRRQRPGGTWLELHRRTSLPTCGQSGRVFPFPKDTTVTDQSWATLVRHAADPAGPPIEGDARDLLIDRDDDGHVAAWVQTLDVETTREHYHRISAELHYVIEGRGQVCLDGRWHAVRAGSLVHIPPGVIHGASGPMRVLIVGVPFIAEEDTYYLDDESYETSVAPS